MESKGCVLIVDDDTSALGIFEHVLAHAGYLAFVATDGLSGMELIRRHVFDLILSDLRMPGMAGLELLAGARAMSPMTPVVIYSAFATNATRIAAARLGAVECVEGPIDVQLLLDLVERHSNPPAGSRRSDVIPRTAGTADAEPRPEFRETRPGHAAARWASMVGPITRLQSDVPTIGAWGHEIGVSPSTIKRWCDLAHVNAGDSLDFARLLRIVCRHAGQRVDWLEELAIGTTRTLEHLLQRAGLRPSEAVPSLETYLARQQLIILRGLIAAVRQALARQNR